MMCFTCCVYKCFKSVAPAQHSEPLRHLGWFVYCSRVCMCRMRAQLLVRKKTSLRTPSTRALLFEFKSTYTEASLVVVDGLVGRFEASVPWHRSRLLTTVAWERPIAVWAICRKCCRIVCRPCSCWSTKQKHHAQPERKKCVRVYVYTCVCVREKHLWHAQRTVDLLSCMCVWERETEKGRERETARKREQEKEV